SQRFTIYVYNSNGSYITQIGKKGRGPGEFQNIYSLDIHENQLYAYDYQQRKIYVFSLGSFILSHTINLNPENWNHIKGLKNSFPTRFFARNDEVLLMSFTQIPQPNQFDEQTYKKYFLLNKKGEIISDLVYQQKGVEYLISNWGGGLNLLKPPFTRSSLMAVSEDGTIFSAWSEEFLIKVYSPEGHYLYAFYYPLMPSSLNKKSFLDLYNEQPLLQKSYKSSKIPNTWPVLNQMLLDDENRLWVSTITDNEDYYLWWVVDEEGKLLARLKWPGKRLARDISKLNRIIIKNGFLYAIEANERNGLQEVVQYRVKIGEL
ncbi:MAG TPA: 6-bladed beta-propeller, partial [Bacteroidales bacterium]|nr:6-bladed beta-propeller [Bacteroidales bacterium]